MYNIFTIFGGVFKYNIQKFFIIGFFLVISLSAGNSFAAGKFVCKEPKGMRVDWGDVFNLDNELLRGLADGPDWREDGFSNIIPQIIIQEEQMLLSWGNTRPEDLRSLLPEDNTFKIIPILGRTNDAVWGITQKNATVEIVRYYYDTNLLFRLTSGVGFSGNPKAGLPAMAAIYIADCKPES